MAPTKRPRVQAQRKFAQGVYIPPQQSLPQVLHNSSTQTSYPKVQTKVHLQCKELLDVLSLKDFSEPNIRTPVVVLENVDTHYPKVSEVLNGRTETNKIRNLLGQSRERILLTPVREQTCRKLGSRVTDARDSEGSQISPERSPPSPMRPKRRRSSSVTDAEENRPLQLLYKEKRQITPPMLNIDVQVTRLEDSHCQAVQNGRSRTLLAGLQRRVSSASCKVSSVPLAILKAQRQGLRMSLRQMKKRNTPGYKKCTWGVTKRQYNTRSADKKKPKKSGASREKVAATARPATTIIKISPRAHTAVDAIPIRHEKDKQKEPATKSGAAANSRAPTVLGVQLPRETDAVIPTSNNSGNNRTSINFTMKTGGTERIQIPHKETSPSTSAFKVPSGVAKRSATRKPICQPGPEDNYCGSCERCTIIDDVIIIDESIDTPHGLTRVLNAEVKRVEDNTGDDFDRHDIYDFRNEDERINEPSPYPRLYRARSLNVQERANSVANVFGCKRPSTQSIMGVIDKQIIRANVLMANNKRPTVTESCKKIISLMQEFKKKFYEFDEIKNEESEELQEGGATPSVAQTTASDSPSISSWPSVISSGEMLLDAPVFRPTLDEMRDLTSYLRKISPTALHYGICKIVPPDNFKPPCNLNNVSFKSNNQYISTMYNRWGPVVREMTAIKAQLATQNITFTRPPLFEGIEVDIVKLYNLVQKYGGLLQVMREQSWADIAEEMKLSVERINPDLKLDNIYLKFVLPYDSMSSVEREQLLQKVEEVWQRRYSRMQARASNPLLHVRQQLGDEDSESSDEEEPVAESLLTAFAQTEDCIVSGQKMSLDRFKRVGQQVREMYFQNHTTPDPKQVEDKYWRKVMLGIDHVCVYSASLDTSQEKLGFPVDEPGQYTSHPWNLKRLGVDPRNVLSFLGKTLPVTIPTLHLGMMFSSNCWHMDPHHLPWTEYMHEGPPKIWYGISSEQSAKFRSAMESLCPTVVQNKSIWLPSDMAMVPPQLLIARGVRLARVLQRPGEYVVVLPRAYSCSISTGVTVSESLYFAEESWLDRITDIFKELRAACEPSMFAAEQLLSGIIRSPGEKSPSLVRRARTALLPLAREELAHRAQAAQRGITQLSVERYLELNQRCTAASWQVRRAECDLCRCTLFWSKMINVLGPRTSVCLQHGLQLGRRQKTRDVVVIKFTPDEELNF